MTKQQQVMERQLQALRVLAVSIIGQIDVILTVNGVPEEAFGESEDSKTGPTVFGGYITKQDAKP